MPNPTNMTETIDRQKDGLNWNQLILNQIDTINKTHQKVALYPHFIRPYIYGVEGFDDLLAGEQDEQYQQELKALKEKLKPNHPDSFTDKTKQFREFKQLEHDFNLARQKFRLLNQLIKRSNIDLNDTSILGS